MTVRDRFVAKGTKVVLVSRLWGHIPIANFKFESDAETYVKFRNGELNATSSQKSSAKGSP